MSRERRHKFKRPKRSAKLGHVEVYDNGGETADRYTIVFLEEPERQAGLYNSLGLSSNPDHPQGFSQHSAAMPGEHLGKKITFGQLPINVQRHVLARLRDESR